MSIYEYRKKGLCARPSPLKFEYERQKLTLILRFLQQSVNPPMVSLHATKAVQMTNHSCGEAGHPSHSLQKANLKMCVLCVLKGSGKK